MKRGAFDYLDKPFDLDQMTTLLRASLRRIHQGQRSGNLTPTDSHAELDYRQVSADSGSVQADWPVAPLDVTVLILGESGTGKELVAGAPSAQQTGPHAISGHQLRRHPRWTGRKRTLRTRSRSVHRCNHTRIGRFEQAERRHDLVGRNRRHAPARSGESTAILARPDLRAGRRPPAHHDQCSCSCRNKPGPGGTNCFRAFPE